MPKGPPVLSVNVRDFALITYAVAAERVKTHLPSAYQLDTFEGAGGEYAFVTTTCFSNEHFRPVVGFPRQTFDESTYRTYVTHKDRSGVYFFGRYLGTNLAWLSQRPIARHTYTGDFHVAILNGGGDYASYTCDATSSAGQTRFALKADQKVEAKPPFSSGNELVQFLTYRLHGFYTDVIGAQGHMPVTHPRMNPVAGFLTEAKFDLWDELGIVTSEEIGDPYSVLVVSEVPFKLHAPRLMV